MPVIVESNVLRITVLQVRCQRYDRLLPLKVRRVQAVEVLSMRKYCIRICKPILMLLIVYEPPFVAITFDN